MDQDREGEARLLRAVADPNRLAILRRLACGGSVAACDLDCCNVNQPTVSHHLKVLREAGWVRADRQASRVYYSLQPAAAEWFRSIADEFAPPGDSPSAHRPSRADDSVDPVPIAVDGPTNGLGPLDREP